MNPHRANLITQEYINRRNKDSIQENCNLFTKAVARLIYFQDKYKLTNIEYEKLTQRGHNKHIKIIKDTQTAYFYQPHPIVEAVL